MSKVVHLSDEAHNKAKIFCKQHSLKMSDWVAALIEEAISTGRTDPTIKVRPAAAPAPAPMPVPTAITTAPAASQLPPKKKLSSFEARQAPRPAPAVAPSDNGNGNGGTPPWAAPPFWAQQKAQSSK